MSDVEKDLTTLEAAIRQFFQTMKRPQNWTQITADAGVAIDRPAALILQMIMLHDKGSDCRVQDLADQLGVEAPTISRKTQELESLGYIRRVPSKTDGRAVDLEITTKGRAVDAKLQKARRESMEAALAGWPSKDRHQFVELFARFSNDIADFYQN